MHSMARFARGDGRPRGRGGGRKKASAVAVVPVPPQQPSLAEVLAQIGATGSDPRISIELQETFACLPIKRQRLLLNFVASGQIAESARQAGYHCMDPSLSVTGTMSARVPLAAPKSRKIAGVRPRRTPSCAGTR